MKNPLKIYLDSVCETPHLFSRRAGISAPAAYEIYNGKRIPNKKTRQKIFEATNGIVKPDDFPNDVRYNRSTKYRKSMSDFNLK